MPDFTEDQSIQHVRDMKTKNTNHLVQHDADMSGEVDIEVLNDGRYNVIVHKGTDHEPQTVENVSKNELVQLIKDRL